MHAVGKVHTWGIAQCLGWLLILASNLIFLFHVLLISVRLGRRSAEGPTLLGEMPKPAAAGLETGGAGV